MVFRHRHSQILEYGNDLSRSSVLRTQTVTTTYDYRSISCTIIAVFNIEVQRFAVRTRFLRTVKNCNSLSSLRHSSQEVLSREWTIQVYGNHTYLFAISHQVVDSFAGSFGYRTHSDDYAFCVFSTIVIEQSIFTSCDFRNFIHVFFYNSRNCFVVVVA